MSGQPIGATDYTSGRPAQGYDRSNDSSTSSVSAKDDLQALQARLNMLAELSYTMPQADAGVYLNRTYASWGTPVLSYGTAPNATNRIDFTIDFAGHFPDMGTHYFCFTLQTGRVPGSNPSDTSGQYNKIIASRRYNWNWDAHHNNPLIMMRLQHLTNLIERFRISASGGAVIEEADNVDLACQIRIRAQASQPTPRVHMLFCPPPQPWSTAVTDAQGLVTNPLSVPLNANLCPVQGFPDSYNAGSVVGPTSTATATYLNGFGAAANSGLQLGNLPVPTSGSAALDFPYFYNPPSEVSNAVGSLPLQSLAVGSFSFTVPNSIEGNSGPLLASVPVALAATSTAATTFYGTPNASTADAVPAAATAAASAPMQPLVPTHSVQPISNTNVLGQNRQVYPLAGYWRPVVLDSFRERGYHGVDMLDDVELMYQLCTNVQLAVGGPVAGDALNSGVVGRRFKMKLPCQFLNRQPILPDLKSLRFEITLQDARIAFQGLGSEASYQTKRVCQNEMNQRVDVPMDWWYSLNDVSFECEVVELAPSLRSSISKGMTEGGLPFHWTQWSYTGDTIGTAENFSHQMQRSVTNVTAAVTVFRSPKAYTDFRYDSYRFLNPNLKTLQWKVGTALMPKIPLDSDDDFFTSFRQCFPIPADTLGRIDRLDFEGERQLTIEGAFMAFTVQPNTVAAGVHVTSGQSQNLRFATPAQLTQILKYGRHPGNAPTSGIAASANVSGNGNFDAAAVVTQAPYPISSGATSVSLAGAAPWSYGVFASMTYDPIIGGINCLGSLGPVMANNTSTLAPTTAVKVLPFPYNLVSMINAQGSDSGATNGVNICSAGTQIGQWGQCSARNAARGDDTYCGYRGVVSYRSPRDFIAARSFQTVRGIDLTGLSTLQGQSLRLEITRFSSGVNLRQVALDFDPNARKVFPAYQTSAGTTSAGVSSLTNLSRSLYCPFMSIWDFRISPIKGVVGGAGSAFTAQPINAYGVANTAVATGAIINVTGGRVIPQSGMPCVPVSGVTIQQLAGAVASATAGPLYGGFIDLSSQQGYCAGTDGTGMLDMPSCIQNRQCAGGTALAPGVLGVSSSNSIWDTCNSSDLVASTFVLHTRLVLLGLLGNVTTRE